MTLEPGVSASIELLPLHLLPGAAEIDGRVRIIFLDMVEF
jgi:hypothetical protein